MNEYYDWLISHVPPPIRVPTNSLTGSALRNNNNKTYILDEPVPHMEQTFFLPLQRRIKSLKDTTRKVVNKVKKKWHYFNDDKPIDNNFSYTSQYENHSSFGFCYFTISADMTLTSLSKISGLPVVTFHVFQITRRNISHSLNK